jgi:glycosyltransferase involved in cell wall biosynthesis
MKVLFITYDFPYPTTSGGKNRAYHLLKYTAKKADVFLYSYVREDYNPDSNNEILSLGVKDIRVVKRKKLSSISNLPKTIFHNSSIFKTLYKNDDAFFEIKEIIKKEHIDLVHFESTYTGFFIGPELKRLGVKQVLGTENIEFQLYYDYAKNLSKFYLKPFVYQQAGRLKEEELRMVESSDAVTTITQSEAELLESLTNKKPYIIANGIEPKIYDFKYDENIKKNILFVGNFSYFPNIDAVQFFYKNVFEKLDHDITLTIIGKRCNEKFKFNNKRIIQKDFVADLIEEYRKADILVFPIKIGGGTNFKVLEAMSLGVPIVAQPERLAGLRAIEEEHFLGASTGDEYVNQINRLYDDNVLRKNIAKNSRELIEKYYAWEGIGNELLSVWKESL